MSDVSDCHTHTHTRKDRYVREILVTISCTVALYARSCEEQEQEILHVRLSNVCIEDRTAVQVRQGYGHMVLKGIMNRQNKIFNQSAQEGGICCGIGNACSSSRASRPKSQTNKAVSSPPPSLTPTQLSQCDIACKVETPLHKSERQPTTVLLILLLLLCMNIENKRDNI